MKPTQLRLTFPLFVRALPDLVKLNELSLQFVGGRAGEEFVSGAYGDRSREIALQMSVEWVKRHADSPSGPSMALFIDAFYAAGTPITTSDQLDAGVHGSIHLGRISSTLRQELRTFWLSCVAAEHGPSVEAQMELLRFEDLVLQYPAYVPMLLSKRAPHATAVIHPVRPRVAPESLVWVATVRYLRTRFASAHVRFVPEITVEV